MPKVSVSTVVGMLMGFGLCIWAILSSTKEFHIFFHLESFAIVIGGTIATTLVGYRTRYVIRAMFGIGKIFVQQPIGPQTLQQDIGMLVEWASLAQRGLTAVEEDLARRDPDPYLKYALELLLNGYKESDLRLFLGDMIESTYNRQMVPANILNQMGGHGPAFGMIGTLVGLVIMLSNMGSDPAAIGPAMAMSMLATLYGVLFARLLFMPAASKTQQILEIEKFRRYMQLEGIVLICEKKSPSYVQDRLNALVDPNFRYERTAATVPSPAKAGAKA
jgi:chemotaxis protein MotA